MLFTNKNTAVCIDEFTTAARHASEIMSQTGERCRDALMLAEMMTMGCISNKCNHTAVKSETAVCYERTPRAVYLIPSQLDCISLAMTTNTCQTVRTRKNIVTSAIVCAIQSLVEFADRVRSRGASPATIVVTDVFSVTYAATLALLFRIFCLHGGWNQNVRMSMFVNEETMTAMTKYAGSTAGVSLVPCIDLSMQVIAVVNMVGASNTTVYTHSVSIANMCTVAFGVERPVVNLVTTMDTIQKESEIKLYTQNANAILEVVSCSDPDESEVRLTPTVTGDITNGAKLKLVGPGVNTSYISRIRWFNNMIRHMSFDGMCYDCLLGAKVAKSVLALVADRETIETQEMAVDPLRDFQAHVGTDGIVDDLEF